jgi:hypothetical protein
MIFEIKKSQRTFQSLLACFGQNFHENHLFFEAFEIVTRTNGFSILIFFHKTRTYESWI